MSDLFELHRRLVGAAAPSGFEEGEARLLKELAAPFADEVFTAALGNVVCHKKGSGKKILLAAHMDAIGLIVTRVDEQGFLWVAPIGGVPRAQLVNTRMRFMNGMRGIVRLREIEKKSHEGPASGIAFTDLFVDIGARDKADAERHVKLGDVCVYEGRPEHAAGRNVIGPYADDLIGCAVLLRVLEEAGSGPNDLYVAFTTQEEIGSHGAMPLAEGMEPDIGIAVDITSAADVPECDKTPVSSVRLGAGPAIKIKDSCMIASVKLNRRLRETAEKAGVAVQDEILLAGGTDADVIQMSGRGVCASCVSIPTRHAHSPAEIYSLADAEQAVELLKAFVSAEQ